MKKVVIAFIICLVILGLLLVILGIYMNKKVTSVITLEFDKISIEMDMNKYNKVIKLVASKEKSKEEVQKNYKGKTLNQALELITNDVIEKGYTDNDKITVLINIEGDIDVTNVVRKLKKNFKNKNVECTIITQESFKTANGIVEKYGISEIKASYIVTILKENKDSAFALKDLVNKTLEDLSKISNTVSEEQKDSEENSTTTENIDNQTKNTSENSMKEIIHSNESSIHEEHEYENNNENNNYNYSADESIIDPSENSFSTSCPDEYTFNNDMWWCEKIIEVEESECRNQGGIWYAFDQYKSCTLIQDPIE